MSLIFLIVVSGLFGMMGLICTSALADSWDIDMVDSMGFVGESTSLALDSNNDPHISYYDRTTTALKYARWTGSAWEIATLDSDANVGRITSIALDENDYPHISYYDLTNGDLKYAGWYGDSWSIKTLDSEEDVGKYTSIAVSEDGKIHISYYKVTTGDLGYVNWDGILWNFETIDSDSDVGRFTSIALDSFGNPHISYVDYSNEILKYARYTGSQWNIHTISFANLQMETTLEYGSGTSLTLDSNDHPHIVFVGEEDDALMYARWDGLQWTVEKVGPVREVFLYVSIAMESQDLPHIAYFTRYDNNLHYAKWTGSEWEIFYVQKNLGYGKGGFLSLAIDAGDYPHISYFDYDFKNLRYARLYDSRASLEAVEFEDEPDNRITIIIPDINSTYVITPTIDFTITPIESTVTISYIEVETFLMDDTPTVSVYNSSAYISQGDAEGPELYPPGFPFGELELIIERNPEPVHPDFPYFNNEKEDQFSSESNSDFQNMDGAAYQPLQVVTFIASLSLTLFFSLVIILFVFFRDDKIRSKK